MSTIINRLSEVATQHTVFTKDQVLTAGQLNSLTDYFDDQSRLNRTVLGGVGIVSGLFVSRNGSDLILSKGLGITADGDLCVNFRPIAFDRVKQYPQSSPVYKPFADLEVKVLQLVEKGQDDANALPIDRQITDPDAWTFILLAQTFVDETDICTGTNCDNASQTFVSRTRLVAVSAAFAQQLAISHNQTLSDPAELPRFFLNMVRLPKSLDTQNEWFEAIKTQSIPVAEQLTGAMKAFASSHEKYLNHVLSSNPTKNWANRLQSIITKARSETIRLQYFYEFVSDLCETWNNLVDVLETTVPGQLIASDESSKHLVLGGLQGNGPRSDFTPSLISTRNTMAPVIFEVERLNALLMHFSWTAISNIRVTPNTKDVDAVPGFYAVNVFKNWNYTAHKANKNEYLLGYHADKNNPKGGAENPLLRKQVDVNSYRIEGVLGKNYSNTLTQLQSYIHNHNLPFSVVGALVEGRFIDVIGPVLRGPKLLEQLNYVFKQDLSQQLEDVSRFSGIFKTDLVSKANNAPLVVGESIDIAAQAQLRDTTITSKANEAINLLNSPKLDEAQTISYRQSMNVLVQNAGLFKADVAKVTNTYFPTQLDKIVANPLPRIIDFLDILNKANENTEKEQSRLPNLLRQYPGLELSNEVNRGGTFVLVYNAGGVVIGTGFLSHYIAMPEQQPVVFPSVPKIDFPMDNISIPGIEIKPSLELELDTKFNDFGSLLNTQVDNKLSNSTSYLDAFKDSLGLVKDIYVPNVGNAKINTEIAGLEDKIAVGVMTSMDATSKEIESLDSKIASASSSEQKQKLRQQKTKKQQQVADDLLFLAEYVDSDEDVASKDGERIINNMSKYSTVLVGNDEAIGKMTEGIKVSQGSTFMLNLNNTLGAKFGF